jgi:phosphoglycolate phosphatase-like HAD superfamily hydrolase
MRRRPTLQEVFTRKSLKVIVNQHIRLLPGVLELVTECRASGRLILGLLTGNFQSRALAKLQKVGLTEYFEVGAFGDDRLDRNDLPKIAQENIYERFHLAFDPTKIVIFGDTPNDIVCAKRFGACAVAVATGPYSADVLKVWDPDLLLPDLQDKTKVIEFVNSRVQSGARDDKQGCV